MQPAASARASPKPDQANLRPAILRLAGETPMQPWACAPPAKARVEGDRKPTLRGFRPAARGIGTAPELSGTRIHHARKHFGKGFRTEWA